MKQGCLVFFLLFLVGWRFDIDDDIQISASAREEAGQIELRVAGTFSSVPADSIVRVRLVMDPRLGESMGIIPVLDVRESMTRGMFRRMSMLDKRDFPPGRYDLTVSVDPSRVLGEDGASQQNATLAKARTITVWIGTPKERMTLLAQCRKDIMDAVLATDRQVDGRAAATQATLQERQKFNAGIWKQYQEWEARPYPMYFSADYRSLQGVISTLTVPEEESNEKDLHVTVVPPPWNGKAIENCKKDLLQVRRHANYEYLIRFLSELECLVDDVSQSVSEDLVRELETQKRAWQERLDLLEAVDRDARASEGAEVYKDMVVHEKKDVLLQLLAGVQSMVRSDSVQEKRDAITAFKKVMTPWTDRLKALSPRVESRIPEPQISEPQISEPRMSDPPPK